MSSKKQLFAIFLIVFIDLLGFSLILPLLPYYAADFGADGIVTGLLVASYAAAQLISAPLLGRVSDRFGRRPVLLISVFGNMLGFRVGSGWQPGDAVCRPYPGGSHRREISAWHRHISPM